MSSLAFSLSQGIISSPYALGKSFYTAYQYLSPLLMPKVSFGESLEEIELNGRSLYPEPIEQPPEEKVIVAQVSSPWKPHVRFPTLPEIGGRAATALVYHVPLYTLKCFYNAPLPTLVALFYVLPPEVFSLLAPKLFYYLPRLL